MSLDQKLRTLCRDAFKGQTDRITDDLEAAYLARRRTSPATLHREYCFFDFDDVQVVRHVTECEPTLCALWGGHLNAARAYFNAGCKPQHEEHSGETYDRRFGTISWVLEALTALEESGDANTDAVFDPLTDGFPKTTAALFALLVQNGRLSSGSAAGRLAEYAALNGDFVLLWMIERTRYFSLRRIQAVGALHERPTLLSEVDASKARLELADRRLDPEHGFRAEKPLYWCGGNGELLARLRAGAAPNVADQDGETALMRMASLRNEAATRLLLLAGADAGQRDFDGLTALHHLAAAEVEDDVASDATTATIMALLDAGAPLEARTTQGHTPVTMAEANDRAAAARVMLDAGGRFDPDQPGERQMVWALASQHRHAALDRVLSQMTFAETRATPADTSSRPDSAIAIADHLFSLRQAPFQYAALQADFNPPAMEDGATAAGPFFGPEADFDDIGEPLWPTPKLSVIENDPPSADPSAGAHAGAHERGSAQGLDQEMIDALLGIGAEDEPVKDSIGYRIRSAGGFGATRAVFHGDARQFHRSLNAGADGTARDSNGNTCLMLALWSRNPELLASAWDLCHPNLQNYFMEDALIVLLASTEVAVSRYGTGFLWERVEHSGFYVGPRPLSPVEMWRSLPWTDDYDFSSPNLVTINNLDFYKLKANDKSHIFADDNSREMINEIVEAFGDLSCFSPNKTEDSRAPNFIANLRKYTGLKRTPNDCHQLNWGYDGTNGHWRPAFR